MQNTTLVAHIETTIGLSPRQVEIVQALAQARFDSPESCYASLRALCPGLFVYRGGNHVALHFDQDEERNIIWKPVE